MKKMKKINKFIIGLLLVSLAFVSCEKDEDKNPFPEPNQEENIVPFINVRGYTTLFTPDEVADGKFEATFDKVRDNVTSYALDLVIEASSGTTDPVTLETITSFPAVVSFSLEEMAIAAGLTLDDIGGGTIFRFLGTVTSSTTGESFTIENYSASITGQPEQQQAFNFIQLVQCAPITSATVGGTWILDLIDLYGDGWDGAFLTVAIDGQEMDYTISGAQATDAQYIIDVPDGSTLRFGYTPGAFEEEHVFSVTSPDGLFGEYGPNPAPCIN